MTLEPAIGFLRVMKVSQLVLTNRWMFQLSASPFLDDMVVQELQNIRKLKSTQISQELRLGFNQTCRGIFDRAELEMVLAKCRVKRDLAFKRNQTERYNSKKIKVWELDAMCGTIRDNMSELDIFLELRAFNHAFVGNGTFNSDVESWISALASYRLGYLSSELNKNSPGEDVGPFSRKVVVNIPATLSEISENLTTTQPEKTARSMIKYGRLISTEREKDHAERLIRGRVVNESSSRKKLSSYEDSSFDVFDVLKRGVDQHFVSRWKGALYARAFLKFISAKSYRLMWQLGSWIGGNRIHPMHLMTLILCGCIIIKKGIVVLLLLCLWFRLFRDVILPNDRKDVFDSGELKTT